MQLKKLRLQNYKCFKAEKSFDFNRLTVLTGANSSGKTSIVTGIVSALQSNDFPFNYSLNGDYINLGDFTEISNNKNANNVIKIGMTLGSSLEQSDSIIDTFWRMDKVSKQPKLNSIIANDNNCQIEIKPSRGDGWFSASIKLNDNILKEDRLGQLMNYFETLFPGIPKDEEKMLKPFIKEIKVLSQSEQEIKIKFKSIENFRKWLLLSKKMHKFNVAIRSLTSDIERFCDLLNYISSFRSYPQRTYFETKLKTNKISKFGDGYLDQILVWQTNKSPKYNELIKVMKDLKLLNDLSTFRIKGGRYDVRVRTKPREKFSSLSDVGFGISQFLPIIVADLQLSNESTLAILQPEIHLHPSVQSDFSEYIIKQINSKKKNYIIETHSEYFINKLRLMIVKGEIKKEDVSFYYLENNSLDCVAHKIELTETGEIKGAPKSFFNTYMMDLREIALNSMK